MNCTKCGYKVGERDPNVVHRHRICPRRRLTRAQKARKTARPRGDIAATLARTFTDPRSYVALDGREVLYGEDYKRRVEEVLERDGHMCRWDVGRVICGAPANRHPHHIVKRSKGRDDRMGNLHAICNSCHKIAHPEKQVRWTKQ